MEKIDINKLREDLINYFGTAIGMFPMAIMDLNEVYNATDEEVISIAMRNNFNLENYINNYVDKIQIVKRSIH